MMGGSHAAVPLLAGAVLVQTHLLVFFTLCCFTHLTFSAVRAAGRGALQDPRVVSWFTSSQDVNAVLLAAPCPYPSHQSLQL